MTDDAQTIREALESAFGDWEAGLAALDRLVAALSVATTERDEARQQLAKFHEDAAYTANVVGRVADAAVDAWHERAEALAVQLPTYLPPWLLPLPRRPLNEPGPKSRHQSGRESASGELKDAQQTGAVATSGAESPGSFSVAAGAAPNEPGCTQPSAKWCLDSGCPVHGAAPNETEQRQ